MLLATTRWRSESASSALDMASKVTEPNTDRTALRDDVGADPWPTSRAIHAHEPHRLARGGDEVCRRDVCHVARCVARKVKPVRRACRDRRAAPATLTPGERSPCCGGASCARPMP